MLASLLLRLHLLPMQQGETGDPGSPACIQPLHFPCPTKGNRLLRPGVRNCPSFPRLSSTCTLFPSRHLLVQPPDTNHPYLELHFQHITATCHTLLRDVQRLQIHRHFKVIINQSRPSPFCCVSVWNNTAKLQKPTSHTQYLSTTSNWIQYIKSRVAINNVFILSLQRPPATSHAGNGCGSPACSPRRA